MRIGLAMAVAVMLVPVRPGFALGAQEAAAPQAGAPGAPSPAATQTAPSAYVVRGIHVDISAADAADARRQALTFARREAFQRLVRRLVLAADRARLSGFDPAMLDSLISGIDIASEKYSSRRYIARLDVHFRPETVRALFAARGVRYSETPGLPRPLVLFWRQGARGVLAPVAGPRAALLLERADLDNRLVALKPVGEDLPARLWRQRLQAALSGPALEGGGGDGPSWALFAGADGLGAGPIVVAVITAEAPLAGRAGRVRVDLAATGEPPVLFARQTELAAGLPFVEAAEDAAAGLLAAALDVLDAAWRQATVVRSGVETTVILRVPSRSLAEFRAGEEMLGTIPIVRMIRPLEIAIPESRLALQLGGDVTLLTLALRERGYALFEDGGVYVLRAAQEGAPAAAPAARQEERP